MNNGVSGMEFPIIHYFMFMKGLSSFYLQRNFPTSSGVPGNSS